MQDRRNHRARRTEPAERGKGHNRQGPPQADDHIDLQRLSALPTQAHAGTEAAQVAADQHDISRRQGDIRPARAHCNTDHARLECQRIVDSIPHHHWPETAADLLEHAVQLVLGQSLRFDVIDANVPSERVRDTLSVAGQQQLPTQSKLA